MRISARAIAIRSVCRKPKLIFLSVPEKSKTDVSVLRSVVILSRRLLSQTHYKRIEIRYNPQHEDCTYFGRELIKSRIFASRHAVSISFCVTSSCFFVAPRRILKRIVPE